MIDRPASSSIGSDGQWIPKWSLVDGKKIEWEEPASLEQHKEQVEMDPVQTYYDRVAREAVTAGHSGEAARKTVEAIRTNWPAGTPRQKRPNKRAMVRAAMNANGVPGWVRTLWTLGGFLVPQPWGAIIAAILWTIDTYLEVQ